MFPALAMVIYISDLLYLFSDMVWILHIRSIEKKPEDGADGEYDFDNRGQLGQRYSPYYRQR